MKTHQLFILYLFTVIHVISCKTEKPEHNSAAPELPLTESHIKGLHLLSTKCFSCHHPKHSTVAPNFEEINTVYINKFPEKEAFISHMSMFLHQPTSESALMKEDINKYGLMPKLLFTEQELHFMLNYVYDRGTSTQQLLADFESLSTYPKPIFEADYVSKGMEIAMATKTTLGKQLMQAIQEKGTEEAIIFCNTVALPLTDSVSMAWNAKIKRVTDKPRNQLNEANTNELAILTQFKTTLKKGEQIEPFVIFPESGFPKAIGYYPIETNSMCLQCHGVPKKDVSTTVLQQIKQLYPQDKATGYSAQEIRGMFVVEMFD
jgi:nitrate reductase cytochrome c-type subunit